MTDNGSATDQTALVPLEAELAAEREAAFIDAVANGTDIVEASKAAAYSDRQGGEAAAGRDRVQKGVRAAVERKVKTEGLGLAYKTVKNLMKNGNPPNVQLGAAKLMFALNGMTDGEGDAKDKPLHEMTDSELMRFIERSKKLVEQGGSPPVITVTPKAGR